MTTEEQDLALARLAFDALEDPFAPLSLKLAAHGFVYHGELDPFRRLLVTAAKNLGLGPPPPKVAK